MNNQTVKFEMNREIALDILRVFADRITESEAEKWLGDMPYAIRAEITNSASSGWTDYLSAVLGLSTAMGLSEEELLHLRFGHFLDATGQIKKDEKHGIFWRDSSNANGNPLHTWDVKVEGKTLTTTKSSGFGVSQETAIMPAGGAEAQTVIAVMRLVSQARQSPVFFDWNGTLMRAGDGVIIAVNSAVNPLAKYL